MSRCMTVLCWGLAFLLLALGNAGGWISDANTKTMFVVFGALLVPLSARNCVFSRKKRA